MEPQKLFTQNRTAFQISHCPQSVHPENVTCYPNLFCKFQSCASIVNSNTQNLKLTASVSRLPMNRAIRPALKILQINVNQLSQEPSQWITKYHQVSW